MGLGSCLTFLKYFVFIINFIFWLLGGGLLGVGLWLRFDKVTYQIVNLDDSNQLEVLYTLTYIVIAAGAIMFLISFLGCCGAYQESRCMLAMFFAFMVILFLGEVVGGIVAYTKKEDLAFWFRTSMKTVVQVGYTGGQDIQSVSVDWIQQNLECCGGDAYTDWVRSAWASQDASRLLSVPESCCQPDTQSVDVCSSLGGLLGGINPNLYNVGCGTKIVQFFRDHFDVMIGGILGLAGVELLGMIMSMLLYCGLQRVDQNDF